MSRWDTVYQEPETRSDDRRSQQRQRQHEGRLCSSLILALLHSTLPLAIRSFTTNLPFDPSSRHSFTHSFTTNHPFDHHRFIINLDKTRQEETNKNTIIETT